MSRPYLLSQYEELLTLQFQQAWARRDRPNWRAQTKRLVFALRMVRISQGK